MVVEVIGILHLFHSLVRLLDDTGGDKVVDRHLMLIATHVQADILAETCQGALGDAHSHLRAAYHKDVVLQHVLPYLKVIACLTIVLFGILALASLTGKVYLAPLGFFHALEN